MDIHQIEETLQQTLHQASDTLALAKAIRAAIAKMGDASSLWRWCIA